MNDCWWGGRGSQESRTSSRPCRAPASGMSTPLNDNQGKLIAQNHREQAIEHRVEQTSAPRTAATGSVVQVLFPRHAVLQRNTQEQHSTQCHLKNSQHFTVERVTLSCLAVWITTTGDSLTQIMNTATQIAVSTHLKNSQHFTVERAGFPQYRLLTLTTQYNTL